MNLRQLRELAEAAIPTRAKLDGMLLIDGQAEFYFHKAANPATILALLDLIELQHKALNTYGTRDSVVAEALAAYDKFNKE